ncbi:MAG: aldose epimerase family protein [Bacteriovoracia bacterium]
MTIRSYTLMIPGEIEVTFLNYGGIIQKILVPDSKGEMNDVVLGFDRAEDYLSEHPYFGALIGRYANRIANAEFELDGKTYLLNANHGKHTLHGGKKGLDKVFWEVEKDPDGQSCTLKYRSPDGEEGYPGNLEIEVTYTITPGREFIISYHARTDKKTFINLTSHMYFNLGGVTEETILNHELWINADHFTAVDKDLIPSGEIFTVKGAKDFREHKTIGKNISDLPGGYDFNYVLNKAPLRDPKARIKHPASGRMLEILTTEPGLQFYSGHLLDGTLKGKNGLLYQKYQGLCLETQHYPDSPHHPQFPSTLLKPGEEFTSRTIYKFSS